MATVIKCSVEGISEELEVIGGLNFGLTSLANVKNATQKITFGPIEFLPFLFKIADPGVDVAQEIFKWLADHEVKNSLTFKISEASATEKPKEIKIEKACLESYYESTGETDFSIALSVCGQVVTINGVTIDQTNQR
jgi:hypothetical protein